VKYIRIMNPADKPVPRTYLEKMGISTKRDDNNTIGQFGSGVKLAPIAALRRNWQWIFAGEDEKSPYILEYTFESHDDGFDHVMYEYTDIYDGGSETYRKETSFTLDAGVLSWDSPFQIFREAFANAVDENIQNNCGFTVDIVDVENVEDLYVKGHFCVYLTADRQLVEFIDNFDNYFCINRTLLDKAAGIGAYESVDAKMRFYHKGILVTFDNDWGIRDKYCVFDYEIDQLRLNEERRMRDSYACNSYVASFVYRCQDVDILRKLLISIDNEKYFEYHLASYMAEKNPYLLEAWKQEFGEKAVVVYGGTPNCVKEEIKARGYTPILVTSEFWAQSLDKSNVPNGEHVTHLALDIEEVKINQVKSDILEKAVAIVGSFDDRIYEIEKIRIFKQQVTQQVIGIYKIINGKSYIYILEEILDDLELIVGTLVHELDHHLSANSKHDASFRDLADRRIAKLMVDNYKDVRNVEIV
jgi:hypothetical protein